MPPLYDYKCSKCGKTQEHIVRISEIDDFKPDTDCCKKSDPQRYLPSQGAPKFAKSNTWRAGGSKGNWIILLGGLGWLTQYLDIFL